MGILLPLITLVGWGVGEFLNQRAVKKIGSLELLFFITAFATVWTTPFVILDFPTVLSQPAVWQLAVGGGFLAILGSWANFESLRQGKLAIVEPVLSLELPFTMLMGVVFYHEVVRGAQWWLAGLVLVGIMLTVSRRFGSGYKLKLEAGVFVALVGAIVFGVSNALFGRLSQIATPFIAFWFVDTLITLSLLIWLVIQKKHRTLLRQFTQNPKLIVLLAALQSIAWIAFGFSVREQSIAVTIAITESYVALAALLGIYFNRERLKKHQYIGMGLALCAAVVLAVTSQT